MGTRLDMGPGFLIVLACLLLVLPLPWVLGVIAAAGIHEGAHLAAIYGMKGKAAVMRLGLQGAEISLTGLSYGRELIAAAAGPAGSFLLLLLLHRMPRTAFCGLLQGVFNLLPIYPLDGGRILFCAAAMKWGPAAGRRICRIAAGAVLWLLIPAGLILSLFLNLGPVPLVLAAEIGWKSKKYLAKNPLRQYNSTDYEA